jgi:regulatory protein
MEGDIASLKLVKGSTDRVEVALEGGLKFRIAKTLASPLKVGQHLSSQAIERLKERDLEERAYKQGLRMLSRRPHSEYELKRRFRRKGLTDAGQEAVIERLRKIGLVDDRAFAEAWVENRLTFRPRGAKALRYELRKKGVPSEAIHAALEGIDEEAAALDAAKQGARRLKNLSWEVFRRRLTGYLARRGFSYSTVSPLVKQMWRETCGHEEEESED